MSVSFGIHSPRSRVSRLTRWAFHWFGVVVLTLPLTLTAAASTSAPPASGAPPVCPPVAAVCPLPNFTAPLLYSVPVSVQAAGIFSMAEGDFNGDGIPDFATVSPNLSNFLGTVLAARLRGNDAPLDLVVAEATEVAVFLGNGDGTFRAPTIVPIPSAADSDAGGGLLFPEIPSPITVLLGNGDGSFEPAKTVATLSSPITSMAVGDFNGDGRLDLASGTRDFIPVAGQEVNAPLELAILLGNGDGTFQSPNSYAAGESVGLLTDMAVGDFNGDGKLDIMSMSIEGLWLSLGNGDGSFLPAPLIWADPTIFLATLGPTSFAVGDFNGDGALDVAMEYDSARIDVLLGTGTGAFVPITSADSPTYPIAAKQSGNGHGDGRMAAADISGDGKLDLIVTTGNGNTLAVLHGNGDGTFQPAVIYPLAGVVNDPLIVADVNQDGLPDVVVGSSFGHQINDINYFMVMLNQGQGTFAVPQQFPVISAVSVASGNTTNPFSLALGDFNHDGKRDLVVANYATTPIEPLLDGQLTLPLVVTPAGENGFLAFEDATVSVLLGNGDGSFQNEIQYLVGTIPLAVVVGDLTGDGKQDIVTANSLSDDLSLLKGNGDGTFQPFSSIRVGINPNAMVLGDFNGDGKPDIAVTNLVDNDVAVLINQSTPGAISFKAPDLYPVGVGPNGIVAGDFTGSGRLDLAVINFGDPSSQTSPSTLSVLIGNGDGTFQPALAQTLWPGPGANAPAVGDFGGNGKLDLAIANFSLGEVMVLHGHGDGTFTPAETYTVGAGPESLAVADFNGDGKPDLAVDDINDNTIALLLGRGDGSFIAAADKTNGRPLAFGWPAFAHPAAIAVGDLTGNGKPDIVATNFLDATGDATVTVLDNTTPTLLPPLASLVASVIRGVAPLTVSFDASSSRDPNSGGAIAQYTFDFGDGSSPVTQAAPVVTHTYQTAGTFQPTVTVTDSERGTAVAMLTVTVTSGGGTPPPSGPLAAHMTATPLSGTAPLDVSFDASGSTGDIQGFTFNFGDGSAEQTGTSPTASHTYNNVGSFSASLTVADGQGGTASQAIVITVEQAGATTPTLPVASLAVTPAGGQAPLNVAFDGSGSHDPAGDAIVSYTFDFGDNSATVTQATPKVDHPYDAAGTYRASLTVSDSQGQTSEPVFVTITLTTSVVVTPPGGPVAALKLTNNKGPAPLTVGFDGAKSFDPAGGTIQSYTFDFGDGSAIVTQAIPTASHVYLVPGTYTPSLSVTNQDGVVSPSPAKGTVEATGPGSKGGGAFGWLTLLPLLGVGLAQRRKQERFGGKSDY